MIKLLLALMPIALFGCYCEVFDDEHLCDDGHCDHRWDGDWNDWDADDRRDGDEDDAAVGDGGAGTDAGDPASNDGDPPPGELADECVEDADCEAGAYCESATGCCVDAIACEQEADCDPGFNCDEQEALCLPADAERCSELYDEDACVDRDDCEPLYAGVSCSCGPECTCMGGEPGCVCEDFEFFRCLPVEVQEAQSTADAG